MNTVYVIYNFFWRKLHSLCWTSYEIFFTVDLETLDKLEIKALP